MIVQLFPRRNPATEVIGLPVQVSASSLIGSAYTGLRGTITAVEDGECLVRLDKASHKRHCEIEASAFSEAYRDCSERQWFCSGVLEVVE